MHEELVRTLLSEIAAGEIEEGAWLPSEVELKLRHDVSRGVVREAIMALRIRGVLFVRHGRGQQVQPEDSWDLLDDDVLVAMASEPRRHNLVLELLECRRVVESEAAALAAERASDDDIAALAVAFEEMRAARRRGEPAEPARTQAEIDFHEALTAGARNRPMRRMLAPVHVGLASARYARIPGRAKATLKQHEQILAAIQARDGSAARAAIVAHVDELTGWLGRKR
jgi:DNA-binding FadR family transcriptional regulator